MVIVVEHWQNLLQYNLQDFLIRNSVGIKAVIIVKLG
jgi:hypothetical protein